MNKKHLPAGYWRDALCGVFGLALMALLPNTAQALPDGDYKIIEAEEYLSNTTECNQDWTLIPPTDGNQTPHMRALPDLGESYPDPEDPRLPTMEYQAELKPNTIYHVWVRGRAQGDDNSFYWSTNNQSVRLGLPSTGTFEWSNVGTITTAEDSVLPFKVKMREDGLSIDKYAFIEDGDYVPSAEGPMIGQRNLSPGIRLNGNYYVGVDEATILKADVVDDGLPFGTLEFGWSKAEGPGDIIFSNPTEKETQAYFTEPGSYTLSFFATDGAAQSESSLLMEVVKFPLANQVHRMVDGLMVIDFEHPAGVGLEGEQWNNITAPNMGGSSVQECAGGQQCQVLSFHVEFPEPGNFAVWFKGIRTQGSTPTPTSVVVTVPTERDQPSLTFAPRTPTSYWVRRTSSDAVAQLTITQAGSHRLTVVNQVGDSPVGIDRLLITPFRSYSPRISEPEETLFILDKDRPNFGPFILSIDGPGSTYLNFPTTFIADVTDDDKPNGVLIYEWEMIDGPQDVIISSVNTPETDITFVEQGSYTIRLNVSDGALSTYRDFLIDAAGFRNEPPEVNAGQELRATIGLSTLLYAAITDDGHPSGTLDIEWSQLDGPADVQFDSPKDQRSTFVTFPELGEYRMQASANDSEFETVDELVVTVVPPNDPPSVNVGPDITVDVDQTLSLTPEVEDDGRPNDSLAFTWRQITGPEDASFSAVDQADTDIQFTAVGDYRFELDVNDGEKSSSDSLNVTVEEANTAPVVNAGDDQTGEVSKWLELTGTVSDDGKPVDPPTVGWTLISGPGELLFDGPSNMLSVRMGFSVAGEYTVALEAYDGALRGSDEIVIDVSPQNQAPTVDAGDDLVVRLGDEVALNGTVSDDGQPTETMLVEWSLVEGPGFPLFNGTTQDGKDSTQFDVLGTYTLRLSANDGEFEVSDDIQVEVRPQNQPPVVEAGDALQGRVGTTLALPGVVTDDGEPNGTLTANWSQLDGPAEVTFGETSAQGVGSAEFTQAGSYVLMLTASDGEETVSDEVIVNVRPENQAPTVDAGSDLVGRVGTTLTLTGSVNDDGEPDGNLTVEWQQVDGPADVTFGSTSNAGEGSAEFTQPGTYTLRLSADDGDKTSSDVISVQVRPENQAPTVDAGSDLNGRVGTTLALTGTVNDDGEPDGTLTVEWTQVDGPADVTFGTTSANGEGSAEFTQAGTYTLRLSANDGEETASDDIVVAVRPENQAPTVDAGSDLVGRVGTTLTLTGSVNDDGEPDGNLTVTWQQVDGPADVTFGSTSNAGEGSAEFTQAGTYTLRLTADDGEMSASDVISVQVRPENQPPSVNAGPDDQGRVGTNFTLRGQASDDGEPDGNLTVTWQQSSGPAGVTFNVDAQGQGQAAFPEAGTYVLEMSANDGQYTQSDSVTIEVRPENQPPSVNAGTDAVGRVGEETVLNGAVLDDGEPNGNLTMVWTQVSGPGDVQIIDGQGTSSARVSFTEAGTYTLMLSANDDQYTESDTVDVVVRPINQAPTVDAGEDTQVVTGSMLTLTGTVTDDGEPDGNLITEWTMVSGPEAPTFNSASNQSSVQLVFSEPGDYELQLSANDGEYQVTDQVSVLVRPANDAPMVDAGEDFTVRSEEPIQLIGQINDDGKPENGNLSATWSLVDGPADLIFEPGSELGQATVTFPTKGTYVLALTADDGDQQASDEVTITAIGSEQELLELQIYAPAIAHTGDHLELVGRQLQPEMVTPMSHVSWRISRGSPAVVFSKANAAETLVMFPVAGLYEVEFSMTLESGTTKSATQMIEIQGASSAGMPHAVSRILAYRNANDNDMSIDLAHDTLVYAEEEASISSTWSVLDGPGNVVFSQPVHFALNGSRHVTEASFDAPGVYHIAVDTLVGDATIRTERFIALPLSDGQANAQGNTPEAVVWAGRDRISDTETFSLNAMVNFLELPAEAATVNWRLSNAQAAAMIETPTQTVSEMENLVRTNVTFTTPGFYSFELEMTVNGTTYRDLVRVEYRPPNMTDYSYWSQLFTQMLNFLFESGQAP